MLVPQQLIKHKCKYSLEKNLNLPHFREFLHFKSHKPIVLK